MTESTTVPRELRRDILNWALKNASQPPPLDMRTFSETYGYNYQQVRNAVDELYPLLEYGVSPGAPWIGYKQLPAIKRQLENWGHIEK